MLGKRCSVVFSCCLRFMTESKFMTQSTTTLDQPAAHTQKIGKKWAHIDTWVFDLDNTLYPSHCNLFAQVDKLMTAFIADYLKLDPVEARKIQKDFYVNHGTTLNGLMSVYDMDPAPFLDFVHKIDVSHMAPDAALDNALAALPGRKVIFTNGTVAHAENVTQQLGIDHHFDMVFDIVAAAYQPKPKAIAYELFLEQAGIDPKRAVMFEDIARNLVEPHALGMATVWVRPEVNGDERHQKMAHEGAQGEHVHHVTDELVSFLETL